MEDSVIIERGEMVFVDERIGGKRGRDVDDEEKGKTGRLEKKPSGVVLSEHYDGEEMINGVKYEEEKKTSDDNGGFFNNLMGNLVNSPKVNGQIKTDDDKKGGSGGGDGGDGGGGGGIIGNMISNIFHKEGGGGEVEVKSGGGGEEKKEVENGGVDGGDGGDGGGDGGGGRGGGGGIIDNIVSQLPRTLSEDAVPATDEASILIHSIIHD